MSNEDKKFAFEQAIRLLAPLMTRSSDATPEQTFHRHFEDLYLQVISKMHEKGI